MLLLLFVVVHSRRIAVLLIYLLHFKENYLASEELFSVFILSLCRISVYCNVVIEKERPCNIKNNLMYLVINLFRI